MVYQPGIVSVAAVMINSGIDKIISTDDDFDVIEEIRRTDPRDLAPS